MNSSKPPLKEQFELANIIYRLMYIPGLPADADPHYAVAPSTENMRTMQAGAKEVDVPQVGKRYMAWRIEELPLVPGFTSAPRLFLFLRMAQSPINPRLLDLRGMVCYAMQPAQPMGTDPIQAITDILFGKPQAENAARDDGWVSEMFSVPSAATPASSPDSNNGGGVSA